MTLYGCWAVPRSASTAFERMVTQRGDLEVVSEPFARAYYDGPDARSHRFDATDPEATFAAVRAAVLGRAARAGCFVKDMAYQVLPALDDALARAGPHTVLVRDPSESLPSLARRWPDFTEEEAGFRAATALVERLDDLGATVVVIDSDDLRRRPAATVRTWCEAVGLPFVERALRWEPGMRDDWQRWAEWHAETASSRGFVAPSPEPAEVPAGLRPAVEAALPHYHALRHRRLRPDA
jgi:hypothetical protein